MLYVGNLENSPWTQMEEPHKRILRVLISPELDPTQNDIALGKVEIPPGSTSDWRAHEEGELFLCVSGKGRMKYGDEWYNLSPDTAMYVPPNTLHQTYNDSADEDLVLYFVLLPPFGGDRTIIARWKDAEKLK